MEVHADRHGASKVAARCLERALASRLQGGGEAALAVSGGTTPAQCLDILAAATLPWERVHVLLTDERCVPVSDPASNEAMVRAHLLTGAAARARFVALCAGLPVDAPLPFAAVLVGVGEDGHFASLFADVDGLQALLDPDAAPACVAVRSAASPHARVSLNLAALTACDQVVLLAFGAAKRRIIEAPGGYPVGRLLDQTRAPVRVIWAP